MQCFRLDFPFFRQGHPSWMIDDWHAIFSDKREFTQDSESSSSAPPFEMTVG